MAVNDRARRVLWALSGNACAMCKTPLVTSGISAGSVSVVGEECHIVARSPDGPRGSQQPPDMELDGIANLILLCRNDHRRIDENPSDYPVEELVLLKRRHEGDVAARRGGPPSPTFLERLERLDRASRARCIDRWMALGVPSALAADMADDADVGDETARAVAKHTGPVTLLVGDVGVGKSLGGERVHRNAIAEARVDPHAPAPIWLRAQSVGDDLEAEVADAAIRLGVDHALRGVDLVLDGIDEPGPATAEQLIRASRVLAFSLPGSRVLLTTRLVAIPGHDEERLEAPLLSDAAAQELLHRVASPQHAHLASWSKSVQEAARRPLFCIALGVAVRERDRHRPDAPAAVVAGVIERALRSSPAETSTALERVAIASLQNGAGAVRAADHLTRDELALVLRSRLVVNESGSLRFPLVLVSQWLAGLALAEGRASIDDLFEAAGEPELWRTSIAIAVVSGPSTTAGAVLRTVARRAPGLASQILDDATTQLGSAEMVLTDAIAAATEIREATSVWLDALGPLRPFFSVGAAEPMPPMAARLDGDRLTAVWYRGARVMPPAFELSDAEYDSLGRDGHDFGPGWSSVPSGGGAWAWRWTRQSLRKELLDMLKHREFPLGDTPLEAEATWGAGLRLLGAGGLHPGPLDVSHLLDPEVTILVGTVYDHEEVPVPPPVREALVRHAVDGTLHSPLPGPDRDVHGTTVGDDYTEGAVLRRAEASFATAMAGYEHFVSHLFSRLAARMPLAATLPAELHLNVRASDELGATPAIAYWFVPLPEGESSRVVLDGEVPTSQEAFAALAARFARLRPRDARWLGPALSTSFGVEIFGAMPSIQQVYAWLWDDLVRIGWARGRVNDWPPRQLPRLGQDWIREGILSPGKGAA